MDVNGINNVSSSSSSTSSLGCLSSCYSVSSNMLEDQQHDVEDDATSSSPTNDHMFELSDLMSQLPIKRGLSKYYNGKSDSFKNLITLKSLEDVPKLRSHKNTTLSTKMKNNKKKNYFYTTPKSKISKTNNKGSMKASILMSSWNGTSTSGLNNSTSSRFIHV